MSQQLVELTYSKWCGFYSKKNWFSNQPLWSELKEEDQKFWVDFVAGIRTGFRFSDGDKTREPSVKFSEPKVEPAL